MEEETCRPQKEGISQIKSVSEDAELSSATNQSSIKEHQLMEHRANEERPASPAPSYLSMKSEQSMDRPVHFKDQDITDDNEVHTGRAGSPTSSQVSMNSDHSMDKPINLYDGGSTTIEGYCDPCSEDDTKRRAVKTCLTCSSSYCEKHARRHYTDAKFQTHTLVDVENIKCRTFVLPPPREISFLSVQTDSVTLSWGPPEDLEGSRKFRVTRKGDGEQKRLTVTDTYRVEITGLQPGQKYDFSVATEGDHGNHSDCVSASTYTMVPPPGNIKVDRFGPSSFKVHWSRSPGIDDVPQSFLISYTSPGEETEAKHTGDCSTTLTDLLPGTHYTVGVCTVLDHGGQQSEPASLTIITDIPAPVKLTVVSVDTTSATVSWEQPGGMDQTQLQYQVSYQGPRTDQLITATSLSITLSDLRPASEYSVSVCSLLDNRLKSPPVSQTFTTRAPPPTNLTTKKLQLSSVALHWTKAEGMETIPHHFLITYSSPATQSHTTETGDCCTTLTDLLPGTHYTVGVCTVLDHGGQQSEPASTTIMTDIPAPVKLTVVSVYTTSATVSWEQPDGMDQTKLQYQVSYQSPGTDQLTITTSSLSITLSDLRPASEYSVSVCSLLDNRLKSPPVSQTFTTRAPPPTNLTTKKLQLSSVALRWTKAEGMETIPHHFLITYSSPATESKTTQTGDCCTTLTHLLPGTHYTVGVCTVLDHGGQQSEPASTTIMTDIPAPVKLTVVSVDTTSATVSWEQPDGMDQTKLQYQVSYQSPGTDQLTTSSLRTTLSDLKPASEYSVSVCSLLDNSEKSPPVSQTFTTRAPPPTNLTTKKLQLSSVALHWTKAEGMETIPHHFLITYSSPATQSHTTETGDCCTTLTDLLPGTHYTVGVCTVLDHRGEQSEPASTTIMTDIPAPVKLTVVSVYTTSATVSWEQPDGMDQTKLQYQVSYQSPGTDQLTITTSSLSITLSDLRPASEYSVSVCSLLDNRLKSPPVSQTFTTRAPPPTNLTTEKLQLSSVALRWTKAEGMETIPHHFLITYSSPATESKTTQTGDCCTTLTDLLPGTHYTVGVCTVLDHGGQQSEPASTTIMTDIPAPVKLTVVSVDTTSATVSWEQPDGMDQTKLQYQVSYQSLLTEAKTAQICVCSTKMNDLQPATHYTVSVSTLLKTGDKSIPIKTTINTEPTPPVNLRLKKVKTTSVTLCWDNPVNMENLTYSFKYSCNGEQNEQITENNSAVLSNLEPGTSYTFKVVTVLKSGCTSSTETIEHSTNMSLECLLDNLGLGYCRTKKLTVEGVRQIDENSMSEKTDLPSQLQLFLKRLLMMNMKTMNLKQDADQHSSPYQKPSSDEEMPDGLKDINPLDLITALFLCSDGILQQELSLKLALCQVAVPLLMPNPDTQQSTLMLWAMRDIVKQFRSQTLGDTKEYVEKSIVDTELPIMSFVRLGDSSLSKSMFLNLLSNSQQTHNTFVHHNMRGGNIPKIISNGLVEISWNLPSGNPNIDVFSDAVAVANLRGDIQDFPTQYQFLCQTSAAVFLFCDDPNITSIPDLSQLEVPLFIVCDFQSSLRKEALKCQKYKAEIIQKGKNMNEAELVDELRSAVTKVLKSKHRKMKVESMADIAHHFSIHVDEKHSPCETAKDKAATVTKNIKLPLQGATWKELTRLEKEECVHKKAGDEKHERDKIKQREKQVKIGMSDSIRCFIECLKSPGEERSYFLKWIKINLDNIAREQQSQPTKRDQRQTYPESQDPDTNLEELFNRALGTEHFLREVGQLYEASSMVSSETTALKQQLQNLPRICAEIMLAGFPLELMDGDASNIPMKWITDVLKELDSLTKPKNKIRVVSVLGCQSSGKSTLLNTMFGVQFAVSSGRCTRGAFMQLIKVKQEFRDKIQCDFIMIIDTEGLKAVQLLPDNYKHDNELATFVVGLSDISIVNISMENSSDMRDLLQIVAHAFLRMSQKESGKKPSCLFVHQNVPDISAPYKTRRDLNLLLEKLNDITRVASRMENVGKDLLFTDIINYKAEDTCYLPGLWHGSPPMAPVSQAYSEGVAKVKNYLIQTFSQKIEAAETLQEFSKSVEDLWEAVKNENFLFHFRNSQVAEVYSNLSVQINRWEWDFQKPIYAWLLTAETRVANHGWTDSQKESGLTKLGEQLKTEAKNELEKHGDIFLQKVDDYYKTGDMKMQLVEKYKNEFIIDTESRRRKMAKTVERRLEVAVDERTCLFEVDKITKNNKSSMSKNVSELVESCRDMQAITEVQLQQEFEKMWAETSGKLSFRGLETQNVSAQITSDLQTNLERAGSKVQEMLNKFKPLENYGKDAFKVNSAHIVRKIFNKAISYLNINDTEKQKTKIQDMANEIINQCETFVAEKVNDRTDYHPAYTMELLELIEDKLKKHGELHISPEIAADLKIHICGHAAREFQRMHDAFIKDKDPERNLLALKTQYYNDFKDLYYQKDQSEKCKRKAEEFITMSLKPAVLEYIRKSPNLDIDNIIKEMDEFKTIRQFQLSMLEELLSSEFTRFLEYTTNYNKFAQKCIEEILHRKFSSSVVDILSTICGEIKDALVQLEGTHISTGGDINVFFDDLRSKLHKRLVISQNTTGLVVNDFQAKEFSNLLTELIGEMEEILTVIIKKKTLPCGPLKEQQKKLLGCQIFCPECNVPCAKEGESHWGHTALIHRPLAFGKKTSSGKLIFQMCTHTKTWYNTPISFFWQEVQPFNNTITARTYWKFIFAKHIDIYAKKHKCSPDDIPEPWKAITREEAVESLRLTIKNLQ